MQLLPEMTTCSFTTATQHNRNCSTLIVTTHSPKCVSAVYISANHRFVAPLHVFCFSFLFLLCQHCSFAVVRFRHKRRFARVWKIRCFGLKYRPWSHNHDCRCPCYPPKKMFVSINKAGNWSEVSL